MSAAKRADIRELLVGARQRVGLSQRDVARRMGCSPSTPNRLEAGGVIDARYLLAARVAYELTPDEWDRLGRLLGELHPPREKAVATHA